MFLHDCCIIMLVLMILMDRSYDQCVIVDYWLVLIDNMHEIDVSVNS